MAPGSVLYGWAIATSLVAVFVGGCVGGTTAIPRGPEIFYANLVTQAGTPFYVRLVSAVLVEAGDGQDRTAYVLESSPRADFSSRINRLYLDGTLQVVRRDLTCFSVNQNCAYTEYDWFPLNGLAPYGVGWAWLASTGQLESWASRFAWPISGTLNTAGRDVVLDIRGPDLPSGVPAGVLTYPAGRLLPATTPEGYGVRSYQAAGTLPEIPAWPRPEALPKPSSRETLFPGAGEELLASGFSPRELWDGLMAQRTDARNDVQRGGCVIEFIMGGARTETMAGVVSKRFVEGSFLVAPAGGGSSFWYFANGTVDIAGAKTYETGRSEPYPFQMPCHRVAASPWPGLTAQEFVAEATAEAGIAANEASLRFRWTVYVLGRVESYPAALGLDVYAISYRPPFVNQQGSGIYDDYSLSREALSGALLRVVGAPNQF